MTIFGDLRDEERQGWIEKNYEGFRTINCDNKVADTC